MISAASSKRLSLIYKVPMKGSNRKAKSPGAHSDICLPLADIKRLSEDFVDAKYAEITECANSVALFEPYNSLNWSLRVSALYG